MGIALAEGTLVEGFRIVRQLGSGSMGEVYEAAAADGTAVALKFIRFGPVRDRDALARFLREAKVCATLSSRHLVPVTGYGVFRDVPFLVMRKLVGHTLGDWLTRVGPLEPAVAVSIAVEACEGLVCVHDAGVVHRDFNPANVFLDEGPSGTLRVVLCDFGLAKIVDEDGTLTASGDLLGTPLYMAPEQFFDAKRVDARTDIWALGMTLYHALAGRPAFHDVKGIAELTFILHKNLVEAEVPALQDLAPWVEPSLARVVHAALLPHDRRIESAEELLGALRRWGPPARPLTIAQLVPLSAELRAHHRERAPLPKHRTDVITRDSGIGLDLTVRDQPPESRSMNVFGGRYRLHGKLGAGGTGSVYEAADVMTGRSVAVKIMPASPRGATPESANRFIRRARIVESLDSPHVMKVLGAGVDAATGSPYFVTERLRGQDLSEVVHAQGRLAPESAVTLFLQACAAVAAAHAQGIVHGDIKPSNLFADEAADGTVTMKVRDFGMASELSALDDPTSLAARASTALMHGSSKHLSPEQAAGQPISQRTDVWGLSLALYEVLSGNAPWAGLKSRGELIVAVCTQDVPSLSSLAPWVDPQLGAVVHRGLAREPAARFASVTELANALRPFALNRPLGLADLVPVSRREAAPRSAPPPSSVNASPVVLPARKASPLFVFLLVALMVTLLAAAVLALR